MPMSALSCLCWSQDTAGRKPLLVASLCWLQASAGCKPLLVAVVVQILPPTASRCPSLVYEMRLQPGVLVVLHGLVSSNIKKVVLKSWFIQCTFYNTVTVSRFWPTFLNDQAVLQQYTDHHRQKYTRLNIFKQFLNIYFFLNFYNNFITKYYLSLL